MEKSLTPSCPAVQIVLLSSFVLILHKDCPQVVPSFVGSQGMVVMGTVTPPLQSVSVQIKSDDGTQQLVETDENGRYTYVFIAMIKCKPFIRTYIGQYVLLDIACHSLGLFICCDWAFNHT